MKWIVFPPAKKKNVKEVKKDATLVSSSNSANVAKRIFDYYQMRIEQDSLVLDNEVAGGIVNVETSEGLYRKAIVESLRTNLTGGFVTKAVVIGE